MASHSIPRTCDNSVWESVKTGANQGFKYGIVTVGGYCVINGLFVPASGVAEKVAKYLGVLGLELCWEQDTGLSMALL